MKKLFEVKLLQFDREFTTFTNWKNTVDFAEIPSIDVLSIRALKENEFIVTGTGFDTYTVEIDGLEDLQELQKKHNEIMEISFDDREIAFYKD